MFFSLTFYWRLKAAGYKVQFCTNEDTCTREQLVLKLGQFGFNLSANELLAPSPVARKILQDRKLRPLLLIHPKGLAEYEGMDCTNPTCVVVGGAEDQFTYARMNEAFRLLLTSDNPVLFALGHGWVIVESLPKEGGLAKNICYSGICKIRDSSKILPSL